MRDLVRISQRIIEHVPESIKLKKELYNFLVTDEICVKILNFFPATEIVKIIFIIKEMKDTGNTNVSPELQNLFLFSIVDFKSEAEASCDYCYDGYNTCDYCGGDGKEICPTCDGNGKDEDENECEECDGSGRAICDECSGNGEIRCGNCDGVGVISEDGLAYEMMLCATYDPSVIKKVKEFYNENEDLDESSINKLINNEKTLVLATDENIDNYVDENHLGNIYINYYGNSFSLSKRLTGADTIYFYNDNYTDVNDKFND